MKKAFRFIDRVFELEMTTSAATEGDFHKCAGKVYHAGKELKGVFKLTKQAWESVGKKSTEKHRPLDEDLVDGCIDVLKAELYIRPIPDGFSYVVDYRFFDKPPGY